MIAEKGVYDFCEFLGRCRHLYNELRTVDYILEIVWIRIEIHEFLPRDAYA